MSKFRFILFNTICADGTGDFSHFEDIMQALLGNPRFSEVEFIAIVTYHDRDKWTYPAELNEAIYLKIGERLKSLGIPFIYGRYSDHQNYSSDPGVQDLVSKAHQAITISYGDITENLYKPYFKKDIPIKYIGEHEAIINEPDRITRSLGLSKGCYGIKLKEVERIKPEEAWQIIAENSPDFLSQLLISTNSNDFKTFIDNYILVPAYFNKPDVFAVFLNFLGINSSLTNGKNIIVYHSGYNFSEDQSIPVHNLANTNIKKIELFRPSMQPLIIETNSHETEAIIIKIISGFRVNDSSYDAIYQLSNIAGVSGDNTLERCISMNILPFYRSTNYKSKTLLALQDITQSWWLNISAEARKSYKIFFDPCTFDNFQKNITRKEEGFIATNSMLQYKNINFQAMIDAWPAVTAYLRSNKNFYDNLEGIILYKLPIMRQRLSSFGSSLRSPFTIFESVSIDKSQQKITKDNNEPGGPK